MTFGNLEHQDTCKFTCIQNTAALHHTAMATTGMISTVGAPPMQCALPLHQQLYYIVIHIENNHNT